MFDTTDTGKFREYRQPIKEFYQHIENLRVIPQPNIDIDSPSRKENVFAKLFPVHPIGLESPLDVLSEFNWTVPCTICQEDFKAEDLLAQLDCAANHVFHLRCIQKWWDQENNFIRKRCPFMDHVPYKMAANAGITPEVFEGIPPQSMDGNRYDDVYDGWDPEEDERRRLESYQYVAGWGTLRRTGIELAHIRHWRRRKELRRRARFTENWKDGYWGFGYARGPDKWESNYSVKRRRTQGGGLFDYEVPVSRSPTPEPAG